MFRLLAALGYRVELIASPPPKLDLHEHLARYLMSDTDATCICLPGGDETHRGGPRRRCSHHSVRTSLVRRSAQPAERRLTSRKSPRLRPAAAAATSRRSTSLPGAEQGDLVAGASTGLFGAGRVRGEGCHDDHPSRGGPNVRPAARDARRAARRRRTLRRRAEPGGGSSGTCTVCGRERPTERRCAIGPSIARSEKRRGAQLGNGAAVVGSHRCKDAPLRRFSAESGVTCGENATSSEPRRALPAL